jgi:hypothetical protein
VFLNGQLQKNVSCGNYEQRPQVCRDFEAGSDKCHALRRMYGMEPDLTPEQLEAAERQAAPEGDGRKIAYALIGWDEDGVNCLITAIFADGERRSLHLFNPQEETWWQSEFIGLSVPEAENLIAARSSQESI